MFMKGENMEAVNNNIICELSNILSILGEPTRLSIVIYLLDQEANVTDITNHLQMSQPVVSHHLRVLKDAKILKSYKKGKNIYYTIASDYVRGIVEESISMLKAGEQDE